MSENGPFGENPDPKREGHERILADRAYWNRRSSGEQGITNLLERWEEEELAKTHTAGLFLDEVKKLCRKRGISSGNIFLREKVNLLITYRGFTGVENPNYRAEASDEIVHYTFRDKCLEARNLFREA